MKYKIRRKKYNINKLISRIELINFLKNRVIIRKKNFLKIFLI